MKLTLKLLLLVALTSCASMGHKVLKENTEPFKGKLDSKHKFIRVTSEAKVPGDWFSKNIVKQKNTYFQYAMLGQIMSWDHFDEIHPVPTKTEEKLHPRKYNDDFKLTVKVKEKVTKDQSGWNMFLRVITLGFYKQYIEKEVDYEVVVEDLKNKKEYVMKKNYLLEMTFQTPMLIFPMNMDEHPFTMDDQAVLYSQFIASDLKKLFGIKEDKSVKVSDSSYVIH